jgi:hypothetical protein
MQNTTLATLIGEKERSVAQSQKTADFARAEAEKEALDGLKLAQDYRDEAMADNTEHCRLEDLKMDHETAGIGNIANAMETLPL